VGVSDVPAVVAEVGSNIRMNEIKSISIVIPVFNEEGSLPQLKEELHAVMDSLAPIISEVIFVDDGSTDGSAQILRKFASEDSHLKLVRFVRNRGQTAAMSCGIRLATGEVIVPMDADLQNDPADIPRLLSVLQEGYSCVSGWRKNRKDTFWRRNLPSWFANRIIAWMTGVSIHDYGCSLKAYRHDMIKGVPLYGEMHRFIPAYASWMGARVTEVVVNHRPRLHGQSKYGLKRVFKVLLDLVVVRFLTRYFDRPMHFFGAVGMGSFTLGALALAASVALKLTGMRHFVDTPLPILGALFIILGVQFVLCGLLAEVLMRTYYERGTARPYHIREAINLDASLL
jgi:glycosyltransferase involved in cell wall biosynthesis